MTYEALARGETVEALLDLPVDSILSSLLQAFPTAVRAPNGPSSEWVEWVSSDEMSSFQVEWSHRHVRVDCRHVDNDGMNRIIDVLIEHECPLYDPQTNERFDSYTDN